MKCAVVCWRCYKHDWKNMKKKNYTNEQAISILVVRWPHISSIITDSSNSQTTQQPNAVGNNSSNWNSVFHSFGMWREGAVYCRLTRQRSYLHCWFLVFLTRTFFILLCFFFYYLALQKYLTPWFKFLFISLAWLPVHRTLLSLLLVTILNTEDPN